MGLNEDPYSSGHFSDIFSDWLKLINLQVRADRLARMRAMRPDPFDDGKDWYIGDDCEGRE